MNRNSWPKPGMTVRAKWGLFLVFLLVLVLVLVPWWAFFAWMLGWLQ